MRVPKIRAILEKALQSLSIRLMWSVERDCWRISDAALNLIEAGHCDVIPDLGDTLDTTSDFVRADKLFLSENGA
ncbi:hypothetical protein D3C80_331820 [compost metagenome]